MDINLGKLLDIEIKMLQNPTTYIIAQVKWIFENGELKWGTISKSIKKGQEYWVQLPRFPFGKDAWTWPLVIKNKEVEGELFNAALKKFTALLSSGNQIAAPESVQEEEINLDDLEI